MGTFVRIAVNFYLQIVVEIYMCDHQTQHLLTTNLKSQKTTGDNF